MSSIKHPRAKKDAELKKDHRVYPWEGDKTFRGAWKRTKQRKAKQDRVSGKTAVLKAKDGQDDGASTKSKQPKSLRKTGVVSLKRDLEIERGEPQMRFASFNYSNEQFAR
jgi:hypothetical protein